MCARAVHLDDVLIETCIAQLLTECLSCVWGWNSE